MKMIILPLKSRSKVMGLGPAVAIPKVLKLADLSLRT